MSDFHISGAQQFKFWDPFLVKFAIKHMKPDLLVVAAGFYGSESCPYAARELRTPSGTPFPARRPRSVKDS